MIRKSNYETPITEVMEIQAEGVLCQSGGEFSGSGIDGYEEFEW